MFARFEILGELGAGGMGTVYRAFDRHLAREVVLKMVSAEAASGVGSDQLLQEIRHVARLQHPHILPLLEAGDEAGRPWYSMPLVRSGSLGALLKRRARLPLVEVVPLVRGIGRALACAHREHVLHCDVKPENVLIDDGHPYLMDFGIARKLHSESNEWRGVRRGLDYSAGTPAYVSPEQASGDRDIDQRSDVYSLACMVFEMLAGRPPFAGSTTREIVSLRFRVPPAPLREFAPEVPRATVDVLERAMAVSPDRRPPDADAFVAELAASARGVSVAMQSISVGATRVVSRTRARLGMQGPHPHSQPTVLMTGSILDILSALRVAFRSLVKKPLYSFLAILTLGLGIAASTVMYSVVDGILLRPLPYSDPERIVNVYPTLTMLQTGATATPQRASFSYPELQNVWRDADEVFDGFAMAYPSTFTLRPDEGEPERIPGAVTTAALLPRVLRVPVLLGRAFTRDDEITGNQVSMLSESLWRERFGGDPAVIGKTLRLGQATVTIIGVLAGDPTLGGPRPRLWYLMQPWTNNGDHRTNAIARLRPGVTTSHAESRVRAIIEEPHGHEVVVSSRKEDLVAGVRQPLWILGAASLLLLVIAAANVGALHVGRLIDRESELTVRRALGASRRQLATQLLAEGIVLSIGSAAVAMVLARYGFSLMSLLVPPGLPRVTELALDVRIMTVGIVVTIGIGVLTAVVPLFAFGGTSAPALIGSSRGSVKGRSTLQGAVIVGQIALATVLLYGTGLMSRTVNALSSADPGFAIRELMNFSLSFPAAAPGDGVPAAASTPPDRSREVAEMLRGVPGVRGVAIGLVPLGGGRGNNDVQPEGYVGDPIMSERRFVSGGYFDVAGVRILEGRGIEEQDDRPEGPNVLVVSQGLAQHAWPGESAVGKRLAFWGQTPFTVIGVAEDQRDLEMRTPTSFSFYVARQRMGQTGGSLLVRSADPAGMTVTIRRLLLERFPGVAFIDAGPVTRHLETAIASERFRARLTRAFALCAVLFCALGVYGVIARAVSSRTRELGIRMALGADRSRITREVLARGLSLAALGGACGILFAFWGAQLIRAQLWGVSGIDPLTLVGVAALLVAIAVASAMGPAWRAGRVPPTVALRSD
jgi:predicted permease